MKISEILKRKKTLSFEFFPPKEREKVEELYTTVEKVSKYLPDFVSITDSGSWGKTKHIALSLVLIEKFSLNVMIHLTCSNNTVDEIKNIIKQVQKHGIHNILALKGDKNKEMRSPNHFSNSLDLLPLIPSHISKGIALYPSSHPDTTIQREIDLVKKKIELGAEFGITQVFLDLDEFERMIDRFDREKINIPIIAGILPITSKYVFDNIINKIKKISIPKTYLNILDKYSDKKEEFFDASIDFMSRMVEKLIKTKISGIHFFTLNKNKGVEEIIRRTQICKKLN